MSSPAHCTRVNSSARPPDSSPSFESTDAVVASAIANCVAHFAAAVNLSIHLPPEIPSDAGAAVASLLYHHRLLAPLLSQPPVHSGSTTTTETAVLEDRHNACGSVGRIRCTKSDARQHICMYCIEQLVLPVMPAPSLLRYHHASPVHVLLLRFLCR